MTLAAKVMVLARREADRIIGDARQEASTIRDAARQEGFRTGQQTAEREIRASHAAWQRSTLETMEAEISQHLQDWSDSLRGAVVDLALEVARLVLGDALADRTVPRVVESVRDALHAMGQEERALVWTSVEDRLAVEQALRGAGLPVKNVEVREDPGTESGFCQVETPHGKVDARLSIQLSRIEDQVKCRADAEAELAEP